MMPMRQYSYTELMNFCEHDPALAGLLEKVIDTALEVVLVSVRSKHEACSLQELATAVERLNTHLQTLEIQGCFVDPLVLNDHAILATWAGELIFGLYRQRNR